jgi:CheY-like chemotaxis protein
MPEMNGFDFGCKVKEICRNAFLVILSSVSNSDKEKFSMGNIFEACLMKPIRQTRIKKLFFDIHNRMNQNNDKDSNKEKLESDSEVECNFGKNILLVEDNPVNQKLAAIFLKKIGCSVVIASNGLEAFQIYSEGETKFDFVFMDCQMPVMNGFDATIKIREFEKNNNLTQIPVIAMTANAMKGDKEQCMAVGMNEYLKKPVRLKEIIEIIKKYL